MNSNNAIVCMYVSYGCREVYWVLDSSLNPKTETATEIVYNSSGCGFDKIIKLDNELMAM